MAKPTQTPETPTFAAEIALYGTREIGTGWLARLADGRMAGTGEPNARFGLTEAIWAACDAIRALGTERGKVAITAPGGSLAAEADLRWVPSAGAMKWNAARVYTISAADIERAAGAGR